MRIAIDASRTVVPQATGTERYSLELIRALLRLDESNDYRLYFNQPPPPGLLPPSPNWRARVVPLPRLWTHVRLSRELARDQPDVLFVPAHVLPLHHPERSVVTVHDLGFRLFPWAHSLPAWCYLELSTRWAARRATRLIAISRSTAHDLERLYGLSSNRISVVHEGVDTRFRPVHDAATLADLRRRYELGRKPYFLALGTLQPRKNLSGLLRAYRILLKDGENPCELVLAGRPGWKIGALKRELDGLGLTTRVHLLGYVRDEDLPALYGGAVAYVQPSFYEGFGLTVLEAMACGTAVIASNTSSLPEVLGSAGVLVDPRRPQEIASALGRLAESESLRAELAAAGLRRAAEFSWERCASETLAVLREAGSRSSS